MTSGRPGAQLDHPVAESQRPGVTGGGSAGTRWSSARRTCSSARRGRREQRRRPQGRRLVAGHEQRRDREQEVVQAAVGHERAQQRRAALAGDGPDAGLGAQVLAAPRGATGRRSRGRATVGAARRDRRRRGLGVDRTPASGSAKSPTSVGTSSERLIVATSGSRGGRRPAARPLVGVEQVRVALGAQGAGADEDRVDLLAHRAQQVAVGGMPERSGAPVHRRAPVDRGDHDPDDARAPVGGQGRLVAQAEVADHGRRRARRGAGEQRLQGVGHAATA